MNITMFKIIQRNTIHHLLIHYENLYLIIELQQWEIFVTEVSFWRKLEQLESKLAKKEGNHRGWFTYTELSSLSMTDFQEILHYIATLSTVLIVAYMAGFITILGSFFITSKIPGNCLQMKDVATQTSEPFSIVVNHLKEDQVMINDFTEPVVVNDSNEIECKFSGMNHHRKPMGAVDVLKTGMILASIKVDGNYDKVFNITEVDTDNVEGTWDWWANPAMIWLAEMSNVIADKFVLTPNIRLFSPYNDTTLANTKALELEDQLHKATKMRIQDQMERSWHIEWTDTIHEFFLKLEKSETYSCYFKLL